MSQINRIPRGFQDLLGSVNFGRNPSVLENQVTPTIDIGQFYLSETLFAERVQDDNLAPLDTVSISVPEGENWFVHDMTLNLSDFQAGSGVFYFTRSYIDLNQRTSGPPTTDAHLLPGINYTQPNSTAAFTQVTQRIPIRQWFPSGAVFAHQYIDGTVELPGMDIVLCLLVQKLKV